jgi:PAS domain S-box-containing protein
MGQKMDCDLNIFQLILDKAGEEFYLVKPSGALAYVNEAAAKSLGYTVEEMSNMSVPEFDPVFGPKFKQHFARLKNRELPPFETEHITKDGRRILKEIKSVYLKIEKNEFVCAFARDVTERILASEALQESEEKYRRLVENLKKEYFFYSHDTKGVFNYLSPSITNILGYSHKEFLAHYTEYLTDDPLNDEVVKHTDLSILGIQQSPYEVEIYHKDGSIKRLEVLEVPVFSAEAQVIAVEGIAHDITERKRVFVEMQRKTQELEEVNAAMKVLLRQSSESKKEMEEKVLANLKDLVIPHLEELEIQLAGNRSKILVNVIKSNLEQITSPFSRSLSSGLDRLTPREIQIADLVRNGRTNKEIAELLSISSRTVESYRDKLRTKLKIKNKKTNLRSYLLSRT